MMPDDLLPIKIMEKRLHVDERETEGGGDSSPPKWLLSGKGLVQKSQVLINELSVAKREIENKLKIYENIPTVLSAVIIDDAIAKSHRSEISSFFRVKNNERVIGLSDNNELLIRVDNIVEIESMEKNLIKYDKNSKTVSAINELQAFKPILEIPSAKRNGKYVFKIRLIDFNDYEINQQSQKMFKEIVSRNNLHLINEAKYTEFMYVYKIAADSIEAINELGKYSGILSIEPMPFLKINFDNVPCQNKIEINGPSKDATYPIVGILDSGIANNPQLLPWIIGSHTSYPEEFIDRSHGTNVASIVCFGDLLEGKEISGVNGCKLFDATVIPDLDKETIEEDDLINNIREVINLYSDKIKIWNMSLGSNTEARDAEFSDFGIALDDIQDEDEVIIIKSAGNCANFLNGRTRSRIARGADSVRAITVGSIAHSQTPTDIAILNHISPFSRSGPGPSFIVKPELVHYGGNAGIKASSNELIPNGVNALDHNGFVTQVIGTSFSTPRVSAITADLYYKMDEQFDPLLLKALVLHSAQYPENINSPTNEKLKQLGFGLPKTADQILYNDPYEITLVLRDNLESKEFIEILDFPYPSSLVDEDGYYYGQIILTLVSDPILAENQGAEYCQSNLDVMFGTYNEKTLRDTSKPSIKNPIGRDGSTQNLLNVAPFSKKKSTGIAAQFALKEKMLVQYGNKFYPNKKYAVDLSELTLANKEKYALAPKQWYLKVNGLFRDYIEKKALRERMGLSQEFCIVLTIRDPLKKNPVYNKVTNLLKANNFLYRDIKVVQHIDINMR